MSSIKVSVMKRFARNSSNDCLWIDPRSNFIRQASTYKRPQHIDWELWKKKNLLITKALKGSSIAALSLVDTPIPLHLFYQDPELRVRHLFNQGGSEWYHGERILPLSLSMNESSLHCRVPGLWHTTTWNSHNG